MDAKHVKIAGITADSFNCDSGQGVKGTDDQYSNAWHSHVRLYQRNIVSVESAANVSALAEAIHHGEKCSIVMGALKHVGGTGAPTRVVGVCQR